MHELQRLLDLLGREPAHLAKLVEAGAQVTVFVEIPDDGAADVLPAVGRGAHVQLPNEMPGEILFFRQRVLERRQGLSSFDGRPRRVGAFDVLEEGIVVDLVERIGGFGLGVGALDGRGGLGRGRLDLGALDDRGLLERLLENGVLGELLLDLVQQLELRHLEQLDRLLERRRHDEPLAHPHAESLL